MSRIANKPITVPKGVDINLSGKMIKVKGAKGELSREIHRFVSVSFEDGQISVATDASQSCKKSEERLLRSIPGTTRALLSNMVEGVSVGFEKKLLLVGVGYRAQVAGNKLNLTLGFSHPVEFEVPQGITVETPDTTTIIVRGTDKQVVGQVAADIRAYRPPEPYKGKGVRYADEQVRRKESKKK